MVGLKAQVSVFNRLKTLFALAASERKLIFFATIALFISSSLGLAYPKIIGLVIDSLTEADSFKNSTEQLETLNQAPQLQTQAGVIAQHQKRFFSSAEVLRGIRASMLRDRLNHYLGGSMIQRQELQAAINIWNQPQPRSIRDAEVQYCQRVPCGQVRGFELYLESVDLLSRHDGQVYKSLN